MRRTVTTVAALGLSLVCLTACGSDAGTAVRGDSTASVTPASSAAPSTSATSDEETSTAPTSSKETTSKRETSSSEAETETETTETESTETESPTVDNALGTPAPWASLVAPGTKLGTVSGSGFDVSVYQAGTAPATKDGSFLDPDTKEPLLKTGDELVWVTYVVTNTSTEPIQLGSALVSIDARYIDWPWMQGMGGIVDFDLDEQMGVARQAIVDYHDDNIYLLGAGESFAFSENFKYQAGSELVIDARATPVDDAGELLHDQRVELEGSVVLN